MKDIFIHIQQCKDIVIKLKKFSNNEQVKTKIELIFEYIIPNVIESYWLKYSLKNHVPI